MKNKQTKAQNSFGHRSICTETIKILNPIEKWEFNYLLIQVDLTENPAIFFKIVEKQKKFKIYQSSPFRIS